MGPDGWGPRSGEPPNGSNELMNVPGVWMEVLPVPCFYGMRRRDGIRSIFWMLGVPGAVVGSIPRGRVFTIFASSSCAVAAGQARINVCAVILSVGDVDAESFCGQTPVFGGR